MAGQIKVQTDPGGNHYLDYIDEQYEVEVHRDVHGMVRMHIRAGLNAVHPDEPGKLQPIQFLYVLRALEALYERWFED